MSETDSSIISNFFIAGINYKKTDATVRGQFAVSQDQYAGILQAAPSFGVSELYILSTCNRTEIYGFAENPCQLIELLCSQTSGSQQTFLSLCYIKQGADAVLHFYEVGAGLESQILGDYEIIGQIKTAVKFAKEHGCIGTLSERLVNSVLQSTKNIKNQTALSGGTVSVSFAAIQYLKRNVADISSKKILLLGVGKIGRNTCKNLVDYLDTRNIILINRTKERADNLAAELGLQCASIDDLDAQVEAADIILVATNSNEPIITKSLVEHKAAKIIIDLSVPYGVEIAVQDLPNVTLINVDELSRLKDKTLKKREAEVPKARAIIAGHMTEFMEWSEMRRNVPFIKAVKQKLHDMHHCGLYLSSSTTAPFGSSTAPVKDINQVAIQKVIKNMALRMRSQHQPGCCYIEAINDFITTHHN